MVFVTSSPFLSIFLIYFLVETEKVLHFSALSPRQLISRSNSFAISIMIK